ncbi:epithelial cell adhesion molecule-like [Leucoraja erinacea]|uniref:epithelial cell adhesion molecule-like n=1 Tax=Leucoraja erinaceus TaxID=7782 RepID=UPI002458FCFE|nr:epithelial cell adhesion molecule-like [Leucoraja erinacea]
MISHDHIEWRCCLEGPNGLLLHLLSIVYLPPFLSLSHLSLLSLSPLCPRVDDECPDASPARENCEFDEVCEDASCRYNQYVTCHLNRCGTCEAVFRGFDNFTVNCDQLTPKCRLIQLEMLHKSRTASRQPGGRRADELYDPECEHNGTFKAKQCDDSNQCWCVDSAGVRVTDKTGDDPKCGQLVRVQVTPSAAESSWICCTIAEPDGQSGKPGWRRGPTSCTTLVKPEASDTNNKPCADPTNGVKVAIKLVKEYTLKVTQILEITVHEWSGEICIRLSENGTKDAADISTVAYYIERDLKMNRFALAVDGKSLQVERESVQVWFFDNEPPRINMKTISPGFAAIIIIVALAILTGIAVFVVVRRRAREDRQRIQFEVIEGQEMEDHQLSQRMGPAAR